jgi:hypothetical protein
MTRSWRHTIRPLTDEERTERAERIAWHEQQRARWREQGYEFLVDHWRRCANYRRSCGQCYEYIAEYDYMTGRAGRVSRRRVHLCPDCARRFAAKHGLTIEQGDVPCGS